MKLLSRSLTTGSPLRTQREIFAAGSISGLYDLNVENKTFYKMKSIFQKFQIKSSLFHAGVRLCSNRHFGQRLFLICGLIYAVTGLIQLSAGIYFMLELPIFQLGSNIWTGAWNIFSGFATIAVCLACESTSPLRIQGFLLLSLIITLFNMVNLVVLEVGEWRGFLDESDKAFISDNDLGPLMYSAYLYTTISTVVAMVTSFLVSQHTFCCLQLDAKKRRTSIGETNPHVYVISGTGESTNRSSILDDDSILSKDVHMRPMPEDNVKDVLNLKTPSPSSQSWTPLRHSIYSTLQSIDETDSYLSTNSVGGKTALKRSISMLMKINGRKIGKKTSMRRYDEYPSFPRGLVASNFSSDGVATTLTSSSYSSGTSSHSYLYDRGATAIKRHKSMYLHPGIITQEMPKSVGTGRKASSSNFLLNRKGSDANIIGGYRNPIKRSHTSISTFSQKNRFNRNMQAYNDAYCRLPRLMNNNSSLECVRNGGPANRYTDRVKQNGGVTGKTYLTSGNNRKRNKTSNSFLFNSASKNAQSSEYQVKQKLDQNSDIQVMKTNALTKYSSNLSEHKPSNTSGRHPLYSAYESSTESCGENIQYQSVQGDIHLNPRLQTYNSDINISPKHNMITETSKLIATSKKADENKCLREVNTSVVHNSDYDNFEAKYQKREKPSTLYDVPRKSSTLRKSNSRVSSNGTLRLRVESFKQNSGTQTEMSVMRSGLSDEPAKNVVHFRKNQAPSKPVRRSKPSSTTAQIERRLNEYQISSASNDATDRSGSPEEANSSTSGYSSPSAGIQSPGYSKNIEKQSRNKTEDDEENDNSEITVIQILPKTNNVEKNSKPLFSTDFRAISSLSRKTNLDNRSEFLVDSPEQFSVSLRSRIQSRSEATSRAKAMSAYSNSHGWRVPLPPVPELDRSDSDSISPPPTYKFDGFWTANPAQVIPDETICDENNNTSISDKEYNDRLKALMSIIDGSEAKKKALDIEDEEDRRQNTIQYLAQLEDMTRRLKIKLLTKSKEEQVIEAV